MPETYTGKRPENDYICSILAAGDVMLFAALKDSDVIGGIAAYVLPKFEQDRSEIYIYDLAVTEEHRRQGIATALIEAVRQRARETGSYVIFIQADAEDRAAVSLYRTLGTAEKVLHFDIPVPKAGSNNESL